MCASRDRGLIRASSLTAVDDNDHYRAYTVATCAGIFSLFPLLIHPAGQSIPLELVEFGLDTDSRP